MPYRTLMALGGELLDRLLGQIQAYNANINGSNAYLHQKCVESEALMEQKGMSSVWCSLSLSADGTILVVGAIYNEGGEKWSNLETTLMVK